MNTKDNLINDTTLKKLLHDDNYYKHIFKKTEKIVSVVFYILNNTDHEKKSETHVSNIASKAHLVHEHSLRTLDARPAASAEVLEQFAQALIALDSTFRIAVTTRTVTPEVFAVVVGEIDVVLRGLRSYLTAEDSNQLLPLAFGSDTPRAPQSAPAPVAKKMSTPTSAQSSAPTPAATTVTRQDRIRTILEAKGEATIKDISEIITDCSEKTIQRELNAMIIENKVKRQGERRWSKYSIF